MGLDSFKSDNDEQEEQDEAPTEEDNEEEESTEIKEESKDVEEQTDQSGLASFMSDKGDEVWSDDLDRERSNPWMEDFTSGQWNDMSTKEKVRYVRENYYPGYRPEVEIDTPWEYREVIEIKCKCRNTFTFRSAGTCMDCGRSYTYQNGTVSKKHDPHEEENEEE